MNQTNSSQVVVATAFCTVLTNVYNAYVEKPIGAFAFVTNLTCIIVFSQIIRFHKEEVYKYLICKSIVDTYISVRVTFKSVLNCTNCDIEKIYSWKIVYWIFFIYVDYAAELLSMLFEIAASFNRYRLLTQRFKKFDKISYKLVISLMTVYSFVFYIYLLFDNTIIAKTKNNVTAYSFNSASLGTLSTYIGYVHSVSRNVVCVVFIIVLDVLTLRSVKIAMKRKLLVLSDKKSEKKSKVVSKSEKAELRITLMVVATSVVIFMAYGMSFIKWLQISAISTNNCYITATYIIYWMSFSLYFFIYFHFNLSFKRYIFFFCNKQSDVSEAQTTQKSTH